MSESRRSMLRGIARWLRKQKMIRIQNVNLIGVNTYQFTYRGSKMMVYKLKLVQLMQCLQVTQVLVPPKRVSGHDS